MADQQAELSALRSTVATQEQSRHQLRAGVEGLVRDSVLARRRGARRLDRLEDGLRIPQRSIRRKSPTTIPEIPNPALEVGTQPWS